MIRTLMKHELTIMGKSKKNMLFIMSLAVLLLGYCFMILPNKQTTESFNPEEVREDLEELFVLQRDSEKRGATGFSPMSGLAVYAANEDYYKVSSKMITAFESQNYLRFLYLRLHHIEGGMDNFLDIDASLFSRSPFPGKDRQHLYFQTLLRYQGYLKEDLPISYALIEQKTALQTVENLFLSSAVYLIIFCAIYFSSDVLVRDRRNQSILQGLPLSWYRLLNFKTLVTFLYTFIILFVLMVLGMIILSIQNGFGFLNIPVPVMTFAERDFSMNDYDVISLTKFMAMSMSLIPILIYLFIRLNLVFSLLFRNEWIVLMVSSLFLFSERLYFARDFRELFGIDISYFPQTYFEFGKVVTGEKNYLVNLETITYVKGITVLVATVFVIECILFIVSRIVNKRRFYQ